MVGKAAAAASFLFASVAGVHFYALFDVMGGQDGRMFSTALYFGAVAAVAALHAHGSYRPVKSALLTLAACVVLVLAFWACRGLRLWPSIPAWLTSFGVGVYVWFAGQWVRRGSP